MSKKTSAYARKRRAMGLPVRPDPHTITLPVTVRFANKHEIDLQLNPHTTLEKFREGVADRTDWQMLDLRVKLGNALAKQHWPPYAQDMDAAQKALLSAQERHDKTGKWELSQPEYVAIGEALNSTDALQLHCTRRQLRDAIEAVYLDSKDIKHRKSWRALECS